MRGSYEVNNESYPYKVQFVGLDDICIRNQLTDEIVVRETKQPSDSDQYNRLEGLALRLARKGRERVITTGATLASGGETLAETAARLDVPH